MTIKMMGLSLLMAATAFSMSNCSKDDDKPLIEVGDTFIYSPLRNQGDIKGWQFLNGEQAEMTSTAIDAFIKGKNLTAFGDDIRDESGFIFEITSDSEVKATIDGDEVTGFYAIFGDSLALTLADQGFSVNVPFTIEEDALSSKFYSSFEGDDNNYSSSYANGWTPNAEPEIKASANEEGETAL